MAKSPLPKPRQAPKRLVANRPAATPLAPLPAPALVTTPVSQRRIERLRLEINNEVLLLPQQAAKLDESDLRIRLGEFQFRVEELVRLVDRRNAEPVTPYTVTLDEHASRLVRGLLLDDPSLRAEDVVNGAVYFNADDAHDGSPECFEAARDARLGKEAA